MIMNTIYTCQEIYEYLYDLKMKYQQLVDLKLCGESYDKRQIYSIKIGKGNKKILITGGVHGRESINPTVLVHFFNNFCNHLHQGKERFTAIYNDYQLICVPLLNPDGYMIATEGIEKLRDQHLREQCKTMKINFKEWKYNARGVDINRNFPSKSFDQNVQSRTPASEKETQILINIFDEFQPDIYLDIHSRGKIIYYYRNYLDELYNLRNHQLAEEMSKVSGYDLGTEIDEMENDDSGGNTVHYFSEYFSKPAITIETVEDGAKFPLSNAYLEETYDELEKMILRILEFS